MECHSFQMIEIFYYFTNNEKVARGGIEPTTFALLARRSNQLS